MKPLIQLSFGLILNCCMFAQSFGIPSIVGIRFRMTTV